MTDGLESTRQIHADGGEELMAIAEAITVGSRAVSAAIYTDQQVDALLAEIQNHTIDTVIFASNSLRHPESKVVALLRSQPTVIPDLLARGGGAVVLHQFVAGQLPVDVSSVHSVALQTRLEESGSYMLETDDPLLNFPHTVSSLTLAEGGQLAEQGYWQALDKQVMSGFVPVVTRGKDMLIARSPDDVPGRLVVSSIPLDWHHSHELLVNIIRFGLAGIPQWVAWTDETSGLTPFIAVALASRPRAQIANLSADSSWLRRLPATHLYPSQASLDTALTEPDRRVALERGGIHIAIDGSNGSWTSLRAEVGSRSDQLAQLFNNHLAASDSSWKSSRDIFAKRNVLLAAKHFARARKRQLPLTDREFLAATNYAGATLTTILATAQTLVGAFAASEASAEFIKSRIQPRILHETDPVARTLLEAASQASSFEWLNDPSLLNPDLVPVDALRILEWCGVIAAANETQVPNAHTRTINRLTDLASSSAERGLCVSIEGTASVILAVAALQPSDARASLTSLAECLGALNEELFRLQKQPNPPLGLLSRVTHALACAEDLVPSTVDRLTERLISLTPAVMSVTTTETSLAERAQDLLAERDELQAKLLIRHPAWLLGTLTAWLGAAGILLGMFAGSIYISRFNDWYLAAGLFVVGATSLGITRWMNRHDMVPPWFEPILQFLESKYASLKK